MATVDVACLVSWRRLRDGGEISLRHTGEYTANDLIAKTFDVDLCESWDYMEMFVTE